MSKKITVSMGRTINVGNYESVRLDFSLTTTIQDDDAPEDGWLLLQEAVENHLDTESKKIEHRMDPKSNFKSKNTIRTT